MKKVLYITIIIILILSSSDIDDKNIIIYDKQDTPKIYNIVIDSGHSLNDGGAVHLVKEEVINNIMSNKLYNLLKYDTNYNPYLTNDYEFENNSTKQRRNNAIKYKADFLISIHNNINMFSNSTSGYELYLQLPSSKRYDESYKMGMLIKEGYDTLGYHPSRSNGIVYAYFEKDHNGDYYRVLVNSEDIHLYSMDGPNFGVLETEKYPGILIEHGYVDNKHDVYYMMNEYMINKTVSMYYLAICSYFNTTPISYRFNYKETYIRYIPLND